MKRKDTGAACGWPWRNTANWRPSRSSLPISMKPPAKQLERGRMVTELMKQLQYQPLQVWEMALTLFAVNNGYYDDIDVKKALAAEKSMRDYLKTKYAALIARMDKELSADDEKALHEAIKDWKKNGSY